MTRTLFPVITVNNKVIDATNIATESQNHYAPKGKPGLAWRKAAQALVIRELLLQEARNRKLEAEPTDLGDKRFETAEEALIRGLLDTEVTIDPPSEGAVKAIWNKDPSRFRSPPLWEASHILCAADPADEAACKTALMRATALNKIALENPKGFSKLAAGESDCSSKDNYGALGQLSPGDTVPEFEAALEQLAKGEITTVPLKTRFGYHIIRLDAHDKGKVLPFNIVQPRIAEALEKSAWAKSAQDFTNQLVANADVQGIKLQAL
ncbi:MAG: peptidylprolyl isomerase [Amylibacter sp.]